VIIKPTKNTLYILIPKVVLNAHLVTTALRVPLPRQLLNVPRVLKGLILAPRVRLIVIFVPKAQQQVKKVLRSVSYAVPDPPITKNCRLAHAMAYSVPGRKLPIHVSASLVTKTLHPPQRSRVRLTILIAPLYWHPAAQP
jgi:hypothetical protein